MRWNVTEYKNLILVFLPFKPRPFLINCRDKLALAEVMDIGLTPKDIETTVNVFLFYKHFYLEQTPARNKLMSNRTRIIYTSRGCYCITGTPATSKLYTKRSYIDKLYNTLTNNSK